MRWRLAALIALVALAGISAVADAAPPNSAPMLHVSVTPQTGSAHTRFAISFRSAATTGTFGHLRRDYSVTARGPSGGGCQSSATVVAPPSKAGTHVRVMLSPSHSSGWCDGTFRGTVWDVVTLNCGNACTAALPPSSMIGKFTFRVTSS